MRKLILSLSLAVLGFNHGAFASTSHTVIKGDTLFQLSKKYNVSIDEIKKANYLDNDLIVIGEKLTVPYITGSSSQAKSKSYVYTVKSGDTLWEIAMKNGIPVSEIENSNNKNNGLIRVGEKLSLPEKMSPSDKDLLVHLVTAEAKGEPYAGQVAVATVVLNRVDSSKFPDTIKGVIYQKSKAGSYAFSPVMTGSIDQAPKKSAKRAVNEAIAKRSQYKKLGSLYFYNRKLITNNWILSRKVTKKIGNHTFAK